MATFELCRFFNYSHQLHSATTAHNINLLDPAKQPNPEKVEDLPDSVRQSNCGIGDTAGMPDTSEAAKKRRGDLAVNGWMWVAAYCVLCVCVCVRVCAYDFALLSCPLTVEA